MMSPAVTVPPSRWSEITGRLKQVGPRDTLRHYGVVALHRMHTAVDRRFHTSARHDATDGKAELDTLSISGPHAGVGVHYLPTPWRILDWVHEAIPDMGERCTFIDFGCGKGRAVLSAARRPYLRVIGIEFASELAAAARANVAGLTYCVADSVEIIEGDAAAFELPDEPLVVFLFNPFGPPVIDRVAEALSASWRDNPRPIVVAYLNPIHEAAFHRVSGLEAAPLMPDAALRFRFLSPYRLSLFATPEVANLVSRPTTLKDKRTDYSFR